jgi:hypothetical protein
MSFFNSKVSSPTLVGDLAPHDYEYWNLNLNLSKNQIKEKSCEFLSPGFAFILECKEVYL